MKKEETERVALVVPGAPARQGVSGVLKRYLRRLAPWRGSLGEWNCRGRAHVRLTTTTNTAAHTTLDRVETPRSLTRESATERGCD